MPKSFITDPQNDLYNAYKETEQELKWRWLIRTEAVTMAGGEIVLFDFAMNQITI